LTAQGPPRAIFSRAIERGNLIVAEMAARELGNLTPEEALRLCSCTRRKRRSSPLPRSRSFEAVMDSTRPGYERAGPPAARSAGEVVGRATGRPQRPARTL